MQNTFEEYLNEQKKNNTYTSECEVITEAKWWDKLTGKDKTIGAYGVKIDFSKTDVIDHLVENLKKKDELDTGTELKNEDQFKQLVSDEIASYIRKLAELFQKNDGHVDVRVDNDRIPVYVFEKYREDDEKGYANAFKEAISQDTDGVGFLSSVADIIPVKITNRAKKEKKKSIYTNPPVKPEAGEVDADGKPVEDAVLKSKIVINVVGDIFRKVQDKIKANKEKADKGELIEVYSFPFKFADSDVISIAKDCKAKNEDINKFYDTLANKIQDDLVRVLNGIDNIKDYLGIIPVKNYGFNMYFSDQTTAERAAEELNEGDTKVSSRKRYAKKMGTLIKTIFNVTVKDTELQGPGLAWFRDRQYAKDHIGNVIKDIYPEADSQIDVKIATTNIDMEWLKKMCSEDGKLAGDTVLLKNIKDKIISPLTSSGKENFIAAGSNNATLVFIFKGVASDSNIETYLKGVLPSATIKITKSSLTNGEIEGRQSIMKKIEADDTTALKTAFTSLFTALDSAINKDAERTGDEMGNENILITLRPKEIKHLPIGGIIDKVKAGLMEIVKAFLNENTNFEFDLKNHLYEVAAGKTGETESGTFNWKKISSFTDLFETCIDIAEADFPDIENTPAIKAISINKLSAYEDIFDTLFRLIADYLNANLKDTGVKFTYSDNSGIIRYACPNKYKDKMSELSDKLNKLIYE